jgi:DNA invertase Pin-like site-specific DNA recombinase
MNCLIYVRVPANEQQLASVQVDAMRDYAKKRRLNIVDCVIDEDETVKCAEQARFKNLHRYLEEHTVEAIITTAKPLMSMADYAALKHILECKKIDLVLLVGTP